ncbi:MAG: riboflavin synthase, partial [Phycisphaerales bacterium]|nr:riboflavin synthase [Phycisphaerales bacterium]
SVNGCCLTAASVEGSRVWFDVVSETLSKTTLGSMVAGGRVNLEHACRADALMGGHIVQGHVDCVGEVARVQADPEDWRVVVRAPRAFMEWVSPKGSVTIEGVSLTVAALDVERDEFGVALIPVTLEQTTLGGLRAGSRVNLEGDVIAKTVVHWLRHYSGR